MVTIKHDIIPTKFTTNCTGWETSGALAFLFWIELKIYIISAIITTNVDVKIIPAMLPSCNIRPFCVLLMFPAVIGKSKAD